MWMSIQYAFVVGVGVWDGLALLLRSTTHVPFREMNETHDRKKMLSEKIESGWYT